MILQNPRFSNTSDCKAIVVLKLQVQQMEDKKEISLYQNKSLTLDFGQVIQIDTCKDIFFKSKENRAFAARNIDIINDILNGK